MTRMQRILERRDEAARSEAALRASAAVSELRGAGIGAWVVGSLARGGFRAHSDIDLLLDAPSHRRDEALRIALDALGGFPSSLVFRSDLPPHVLPHFDGEARDAPGVRGH